MVRHTEHGPRWEQSDYNRIKEMIDDLAVDVNGSANGHGTGETPAMEFDVGNSIDLDDVATVVNNVRTRLQDGGMRTGGGYLKAGYRGACNQALLLVIEFEEEVYA